MKLYGLTGFPVSHSWSADYFNRKFKDSGLADSEYRLFPLADIREFRHLINETPGLIGLNVTIPHKVTIIPYLDVISPEAEAIGAVNCLHISDVNGKKHVVGHNTDCPAFKQSLEPLLGNRLHKALILGSGGASRAVQFALRQLGISYTVISRHASSSFALNYSDITRQLVDDNDLIINTTPAGMYPEPEGFPPFPYQFIGSKHTLFDLIYNPEETIFLRNGRQAGALTKNGLEMLQLQAEASWEIWNRP